MPIELGPGERLVLLTAHRRESFGRPLEQVLKAVARLARCRPEVRVLFPVHPNPAVGEQVAAILGDVPRIHLIGPLPYPDFVQAMLRADLILTDSGGAQEEAPTLGKRVLVLRETTERPEGVEAGLAELVGHDPERILARACALLDDEVPHGARRLYGDGRASRRIVTILAGGPAESALRRAG